MIESSAPFHHSREQCLAVGDVAAKGNGYLPNGTLPHHGLPFLKAYMANSHSAFKGFKFMGGKGVPYRAVVGNHANLCFVVGSYTAELLASVLKEIKGPVNIVNTRGFFGDTEDTAIITHAYHCLLPP
jgi:hypothetical protein